MESRHTLVILKNFYVVIKIVVVEVLFVWILLLQDLVNLHELYFSFKYLLPGLGMV